MIIWVNIPLIYVVKVQAASDCLGPELLRILRNEGQLTDFKNVLHNFNWTFVSHRCHLQL
jgi:hypothetical protein